MPALSAAHPLMFPSLSSMHCSHKHLTIDFQLHIHTKKTPALLNIHILVLAVSVGNFGETLPLICFHLTTYFSMRKAATRSCS